MPRRLCKATGLPSWSSNNTATSKLVYDYISGFERTTEHTGPNGEKTETRTLENGRLKLFRNYDEHGQKLARPRTLLIDSEQLESGEALDPGFRDIEADTIERFRREIMERTGDRAAADKLTDADLLAGRWDGARLRVMAVNWAQPEDEPLFIARGELGSVESDGRSFSAELRGPSAVLDAPVVEETSPECRAELGDRRCRVDLSGRRILARVGEAHDTAIMVDTTPGDCGFGKLNWLGGANAGIVSAIRASAGKQVTLREPPPFLPTTGDLIELVEGCDKRLSTCATRFANAENFRGEPHLPGNDLLVRYAK